MSENHFAQFIPGQGAAPSAPAPSGNYFAKFIPGTAPGAAPAAAPPQNAFSRLIPGQGTAQPPQSDQQLADAFDRGELLNPPPEILNRIRAHKERGMTLDVLGNAIKEVPGAIKDQFVRAGEELGTGAYNAPLQTAAKAVGSVPEAMLRAEHGVGMLADSLTGLSPNVDAAATIIQGSRSGMPASKNFLEASKAALGRSWDPRKFFPNLAREQFPELEAQMYLDRQQEKRNVGQFMSQHSVLGGVGGPTGAQDFALPNTADVVANVVPGASGAILGVAGKMQNLARTGAQVQAARLSGILERESSRWIEVSKDMQTALETGANEAYQAAKTAQDASAARISHLEEMLKKIAPEHVADQEAEAFMTAKKSAENQGGLARGVTAKVGEAAQAVGSAGEKVSESIMDAGQAVVDKLHGGKKSFTAIAVGTAAEHLGVLGPLAKAMSSVATGKWVSALVNRFGAGLKAIAKQDWESNIPVWRQLAKDADAPQWIRNISPTVAATTEAVAREGGAVAKHAAQGAAIGAAGMADIEASPEERANMTAMGGMGGTIGGVAERTFGRRVLTAQQVGHDNMKMAYKAMQEGQNPLEVLAADSKMMNYAAALNHLFKGAMPKDPVKNPTGDLQIHLLDHDHWVQQFPKSGTGVAAFADGQVFIDVSKRWETNRILHEAMGHALFESKVASQPGLLQAMETVLNKHKINLDVAEAQYLAKLHPEATPEQIFEIARRYREQSLKTYGNQNTWILGEMLAESAAHSLGGKNILDLSSPFWLTRKRAEGQKGSPDQPLFGPEIQRALEDPELAQGAVEDLQRLGEHKPGITPVVEQNVPVSPSTMGHHPGAPVHDNYLGTGQKGNDFGVMAPDGTFIPRTPSDVKRIVLKRQQEVDIVIPKKGPPAEFGDPDPTVKLRVTPSGRVERTGTVLPKAFYQIRSIGEHTKQFARAIEEAIKKGTTLSGWYQAIGKGKDWAADVMRRKGAIEAQLLDFVPYAFLVDGQGNALVYNTSITALERKIQAWASKKPEDPLSFRLLYGDDMAAVRADIKTYLANHAEGRPGETGLGTQKRDLLNVFLMGDNKTFQDKNPLRQLIKDKGDRNGIIRSFRLDRLETLEPSQNQGHATMQYEKQLHNLSPETASAEDSLDALPGIKRSYPVSEVSAPRELPHLSPETIETKVIDDSQAAAYKLRQAPPPSKTAKAYKLFSARDVQKLGLKTPQDGPGQPVHSEDPGTAKNVAQAGAQVVAFVPQARKVVGETVKYDGGANPASGVMMSPQTLDAWADELVKNPASVRVFGKEGVAQIVASATAMRKLMLAVPGLLPTELPGVSPLRGNQDPLFGVTFDISTVCPQQDLYVAAIRHIEETANKQIMSPTERYAVGLMLQDLGVQTSCWYCYGQTKRDLREAHTGRVADIINAVVDSGKQPTRKSLQPLFGTYKVTNKKGKPGVLADYLLNNWQTLQKVDPTYLRDLMRGEKQPADEREAGLITAVNAFTQAATKENSPKGWAPYTDQILKMKQEDVDLYNSYAGLRMNSQTDFRPWHVLDLVQGLSHAAMRGLMAHVYTKTPDFLRIFGATGIKFNMSIEYAHGPDGKLIPHDPAGTTYMFNPKEGMPEGEAIAYRQKYPQNAGTMLMAYSPAEVWAGLSDPNVDMIIPYHKGAVPKAIEQHVGAKDMSREQHEHYPGWSKGTPKTKTEPAVPPETRTCVMSDGSTVSVTNDGTPITRREHRNDKARYLELCQKLGIEPKFREYLAHPEYMKLVRDVARDPSNQTVVDISKIDWKAANEIIERWQKMGGDQTTLSAGMKRTLDNLIKDGGLEEKVAEIEKATGTKLPRSMGPMSPAQQAQADWITRKRTEFAAKPPVK